jgi:peptide/nickel transport system ATP-binding protein
VFFNGCNLIEQSPSQLRAIIGRDIALIFQDPMTSLNPMMRVGRQVAEVLQYHFSLSRLAAQQRAVRLLDLAGIPMAQVRARQYPHQLSGGLRQRVAIAMSLACGPQLLIADEPTTALDVTVQAQILDMLNRFQKQNRMAIILITHDLMVAARHTHETAVMYAGQLVEEAATPQLFRHMGMPYTQALLDAIPRLSNQPHTRLKAIDGHPPDPIDLPPGCRFAPRCWKRQPLCLEKTPKLTPSQNSDHRVACWYPLQSHEKKPDAT